MKPVYLFIFIILLSSSLFSQENDSTYQQITLINGKEFNGTIVKNYNDSLLFQDFTLDKIYISKSEVKNIKLKYFPNRPKYNIQNSNNTKIFLNDGSILKGMIIRRKPDSIVVQIAFMNTLTIPMDKIENIEYPNLPDIRRKDNPSPSIDPRQSEEFLMPTGINQKGGTLSLGSYELVFFNLGLGITDWLSVNAGGSIIPTLDEDLNYNFGLKIGTSEFHNKMAFSIGAQFFSFVGDDEKLPIFYGSFSYGDINSKINISIGTYGILSLGKYSPIGCGSISGDAKISDISKIIGELWYYPNWNSSPLLIGVRFFGTKFSCDLGMLVSVGGYGQSGILPVGKIFYNF